MPVTSSMDKLPSAPRLGENQIGCLRSLAEHRGGIWSAGCGWLWDTYSGTERIMRSLARHGYAEINVENLPYGRTKTSFAITPKGRERAIAEGAKPPPRRVTSIRITEDWDGEPFPAIGQEAHFRSALEAIRDGHSDPRAVARAALDNSSIPEDLRSIT